MYVALAPPPSSKGACTPYSENDAFGSFSADAASASYDCMQTLSIVLSTRVSAASHSGDRIPPSPVPFSCGDGATAEAAEAVTVTAAHLK